MHITKGFTATSAEKPTTHNDLLHFYAAIKFVRRFRRYIIITQFAVSFSLDMISFFRNENRQAFQQSENCYCRWVFTEAKNNLKDQRLLNMCQGVWSKLKYHYTMRQSKHGANTCPSNTCNIYKVEYRNRQQWVLPLMSCFKYFLAGLVLRFKFLLFSPILS